MPLRELSKRFAREPHLGSLQGLVAGGAITASPASPRVVVATVDRFEFHRLPHLLHRVKQPPAQFWGEIDLENLIAILEQSVGRPAASSRRGSLRHKTINYATLHEDVGSAGLER
jgi:hypothetical protein